jgi:hypothetical protein
VWFGVINAAREICKESAVLRRERLAGLHASAYLASKFVVLSLLVLVQSALMLGVLMIRMTMPSPGVILPGWLEVFITVALSGIAGIALGLCISAVSSTPDKATSLIPIVLVPQVLFAGVMFALQGVTKWISWAVTSRAAVDALSAIADLNRLDTPLPIPPEPEHAHTPHVLLVAWAAIGVQALAFAGIAWWKLHRARRL